MSIHTGYVVFFFFLNSIGFAIKISFIYIHIYVYVCVCVYVCVYIYICICICIKVVSQFIMYLFILFFMHLIENKAINKENNKKNHCIQLYSYNVSQNSTLLNSD